MPTHWNRPLLALALLGALTGAPEAHAQTAKRVVYNKTSFGPTLSRNVMIVTDTIPHTMTQSFRIDRGTTDAPDFVIEQEHVWAQGDARGPVRVSAGYAAYQMKGGDQVFIRWTTDATPKGARADGEPATGSGDIVVTGGTGRYAGVRGTGSYRIFAKGPVIEENVLDLVLP